MSMFALGRIFDIGLGWAPVDIDTANGATGKRISMAGASCCTFVLALGAGGSEDNVLTVQQHTAYTGGTSSNLATATISTSSGITRWHIKAETTLDNDEQWTTTTQSDGATVTVVGATYGAQQKIVVIEVDADQLGDGYTHLSLNSAITTSTSQLGACLYFLSGLRYPRKPSKLWNLLNPGAANA